VIEVNHKGESLKPRYLQVEAYHSSSIGSLNHPVEREIYVILRKN
jgi:hypothetical protein